MIRWVFVIGFAAALGGCFQEREARLEYQNSTANFKDCVRSRGPEHCDTERVLMEADERKYTNIGAAADAGRSTDNVNIQRR